jgi:methylphosphotriester-DNA--protein-cysteine methyltransferase
MGVDKPLLGVSGKGTYFVDDQNYDLAPGTLVWLLPGRNHRLMRSPELDMWVAFLHPDKLEETILSDLAERPCRVLSSEDAIALDRLLAHVNQDTDEPLLYNSGLEYAFRSAWRLTMTSPGPTRKPVHPAVLQALTILRGSVEAPTPMALAKKCGVTQSYLGQLLIEQTGRGFVEWRNRTRLERFHNFYPKSQDLLTAAYEAGFGSYTQFHRVFSELIGTTPGEWARSGGETKPFSLPSLSAKISGSDAGSTRMAWYPLSEQPFPSASRWFGRNFTLASLSEAGESAPIVDTGISSMDELRSFEAAFVKEIRTINSVNADKLCRLFDRNNIFEYYRGVFGQYHLGVADLATIVGIYLATAFIAANHLPNPSRESVVPLANRLRRTFALNNTFGNATAEERKRTAAAFICMTMILSRAGEGAKASGNDAIAERIAAAACSTALKTTGIDLKNARLLP